MKRIFCLLVVILLIKVQHGNSQIPYNNYEYGNIFKGFIEGKFELIVDDEFTYDLGSLKNSSHGKELTNVCFYYLLYMDKHCNALPENKMLFREDYLYMYDFKTDILLDYDDPSNNYGPKYRTEIVEFYIDPGHEPILQFCQPLGNTLIKNYLNFENDGQNVDVKRFFREEIGCDKELLTVMGRNMVRLFEIARGRMEQIRAEKQAELDRQYAESRGANGKIYKSVENPPTFNGGESSTFKDYLTSNLKPPANAEFDDLHSSYVKFIITDEGKLISVKLLGVNKPLEKEILRVVNNSSLLWKPGKQGGKPVNAEIYVDLEDLTFIQSGGDIEIVYKWVDNMPTFNGGDIKSFQEYVKSNLKYPEDVKQKNKLGRVYVSFIVNHEGKLIEANVSRQFGTSTDLEALMVTEALRVISSSPRWTPGSKSGKPVNVSFDTVFEL